MSNVIPIRSNIVIQRPLCSAGSPVVRIATEVTVNRLVRGLASEGLQLRHDRCTGDLVILPRVDMEGNHPAQ